MTEREKKILRYHQLEQEWKLFKKDVLKTKKEYHHDIYLTITPLFFLASLYALNQFLSELITNFNILVNTVAPLPFELNSTVLLMTIN